jgi:Arc/MetJ-type ribon-helix-helix transcriptional regulator
MTIHLPENVERSIHAAVRSGRFPSVDDAVAAAWIAFNRQQVPQMSEAEVASPAPAKRKPIWEVADELRKSVPAEEWDKLPVDGASQHDHYIYGTPKRPTR